MTECNNTYNLECCIHNVYKKIGCDKCKIEHIQNQINSIENLLKQNQECIEKCFERIEALEKLHHCCFDDRGTIFGKLKELEKSILNWEEEFYFLKDKTRGNGSKPYRCPVCEGSGNDKGIHQQNPAYKFSVQYASCQSCSGNGIVWG